MTASTYAYDQANRITGINDTNTGGATVASYAYAYDAADRVTQEVRTWAGGASSDTLGYTYTNNNQLTGVTHANAAFANESFGYDANGNRTMSGYSTGGNNELASNGVYNYAYDANGNLTSKTQISTGNVTDYSYDFRNRLTEVDQVVNGVRSVLAAYTYDVFNDRIGVTEGGATTWTVYDGTLPLLDFSGSGALATRYLSGPTPAGVDAVLARQSAGGTVAWYLTDRLGSVENLVDNTGAVIDHIDYGAYGTVKAESNPSAGDPFKYAGMRYDAVIGDYYDEARWYDPASGRFISQDPWRFKAQDANFYRYAGNEPTNVLDPAGLDGQFLPRHNWPKGIKSLPDTGFIEGPGGRFYPIHNITSVYKDEPHVGDGKQWPEHYDVEYENEDGEWKIRGVINAEGEWEPIDPDDLPDAPEVPKVVPPETGRYIIIGVGGAAAGYACYRLIRLVPSLFPPLWPTLPANVAIP